MSTRAPAEIVAAATHAPNPTTRAPPRNAVRMTFSKPITPATTPMSSRATRIPRPSPRTAEDSPIAPIVSHQGPGALNRELEKPRSTRMNTSEPSMEATCLLAERTRPSPPSEAALHAIQCCSGKMSTATERAHRDQATPNEANSVSPRNRPARTAIPYARIPLVVDPAMRAALRPNCLVGTRSVSFCSFRRERCSLLAVAGKWGPVRSDR